MFGVTLAEGMTAELTHDVGILLLWSTINVAVCAMIGFVVIADSIAGSLEVGLARGTLDEHACCLLQRFALLLTHLAGSRPTLTGF